MRYKSHLSKAFRQTLKDPKPNSQQVNELISYQLTQARYLRDCLSHFYISML